MQVRCGESGRRLPPTRLVNFHAMLHPASDDGPGANSSTSRSGGGGGGDAEVSPRATLVGVDVGALAPEALPSLTHFLAQDLLPGARHHHRPQLSIGRSPPLVRLLAHKLVSLLALFFLPLLSCASLMASSLPLTHLSLSLSLFLPHSSSLTLPHFLYLFLPLQPGLDARCSSSPPPRGSPWAPGGTSRPSILLARRRR